MLGGVWLGGGVRVSTRVSVLCCLPPGLVVYGDGFADDALLLAVGGICRSLEWLLVTWKLGGSV